MALLLASAVGLLCTTACDGCDRPPAPPGSEADGGVLDLASDPKPEELDATWVAASPSVQTSKGEPFSLKYTIPKCSVRYGIRSKIVSELEGRGPAGVEVEGEIVGNPDAGHLTWQLTKLKTFLLHDGEREEKESSVGDWSPALVHTDGLRWIEEQGPGTLWAAHTVLPPLSGLFPDLPAAESAEKPYTFTLTKYQRATTAKIEARRAKDPDAAVPVIRPEEHEVTMSVASWHTLRWKEGDEQQSVRAAVLTGTWTTEQHKIDPHESRLAERWRSRFVVADNGRLIHALAVAGRYQWWKLAPGERNTKQGNTEMELRLLEDCGSPVLSQKWRE